ncbi:hypothetical protein PTKIN_Ptkin09bG0126600 [Pterospermum kingtungense]
MSFEAGNAWLAKFSVVVVLITSVAIGVVCMAVVFATKYYFPYLFTNSSAVAEETTKLSILLGLTTLLNSLQPVLSGVAVGVGWQFLVAYINIECYYIVGLPAGILLGFTFGFGVMGIWSDRHDWRHYFTDLNLDSCHFTYQLEQGS